MSDLRPDFWREIDKIAEEDKDVVVLVGDLGYSFMEEFQQKHPDQFINCGIAEQNMVGVATGLSLVGKKPYVYSTIPFLLFRAYEQIRDDVAFNNANVTLVGTGASGFLGFTHNLSGKEDIRDFFKGIPMALHRTERESALRILLKKEGPKFIVL